MKILVIGSGGREHTLVWKIAQSPLVKKIFCAPGNAGIADLAECVSIGAENVSAMVEFAQANKIDLTIVGPETPLALGIVDKLQALGLKVFGASQKAAELESSKTFSKSLMTKYNIPTANWKSFTMFDDAIAFIDECDGPVVVKADGLAAGKGVIVCANKAQAKDAIDTIMNQKEFGEAGDRVIIEECLVGEEASFIAFTDGKTVIPLPSSQDHKPIFDDDKGPNTGGMGAYSPAPIVDFYMHEKIMTEVMQPTVDAMAKEDRPYKGVLYAGLMIKNDEIKVLEFNCRFGDPEAQPLLMRVKNDIIPIMLATIDGTLNQYTLEIDTRPTVCVVMAAQGYPGSYPKGKIITGLDAFKGAKDIMVFHAGTGVKDGKIATTGGRVLGVTALGNDIESAIQNAYDAVSKITWDGVQHRSDIGKKALTRRQKSPEVGILMGSDSDYKVMKGAIQILKKFNVPFEITVSSAHRTPENTTRYTQTAKDRGIKVIIAGAGHAAHLAGAVAANTTLPVIGVPIDSSALQGLDALLSTVQMPPGVPVATVSIGKPGAKNAAILAAQIIGVHDEELSQKLSDYKKEMAEAVEKKAKQFI